MNEKRRWTDRRTNGSLLTIICQPEWGQGGERGISHCEWLRADTEAMSPHPSPGLAQRTGPEYPATGTWLRPLHPPPRECPPPGNPAASPGSSACVISVLCAVTSGSSSQIFPNSSLDVRGDTGLEIALGSGFPIVPSVHPWLHLSELAEPQCHCPDPYLGATTFPGLPSEMAKCPGTGVSPSGL